MHGHLCGLLRRFHLLLRKFHHEIIFVIIGQTPVFITVHHGRIQPVPIIAIPQIHHLCGQTGLCQSLYRRLDAGFFEGVSRRGNLYPIRDTDGGFLLLPPGPRPRLRLFYRCRHVCRVRLSHLPNGLVQYRVEILRLVHPLGTCRAIGLSHKLKAIGPMPSHSLRRNHFKPLPCIHLRRIGKAEGTLRGVHGLHRPGHQRIRNRQMAFRAVILQAGPQATKGSNRILLHHVPGDFRGSHIPEGLTHHLKTLRLPKIGLHTHIRHRVYSGKTLKTLRVPLAVVLPPERRNIHLRHGVHVHVPGLSLKSPQPCPRILHYRNARGNRLIRCVPALRGRIDGFFPPALVSCNRRSKARQQRTGSTSGGLVQHIVAVEQILFRVIPLGVRPAQSPLDDLLTGLPGHGGRDFPRCPSCKSLDALPGNLPSCLPTQSHPLQKPRGRGEGFCQTGGQTKACGRPRVRILNAHLVRMFPVHPAAFHRTNAKGYTDIGTSPHNLIHDGLFGHILGNTLFDLIRNSPFNGFFGKLSPGKARDTTTNKARHQGLRRCRRKLTQSSHEPLACIAPGINILHIRNLRPIRGSLLHVALVSGIHFIPDTISPHHIRSNTQGTVQGTLYGIHTRGQSFTELRRLGIAPFLPSGPQRLYGWQHHRLSAFMHGPDALINQFFFVGVFCGIEKGFIVRKKTGFHAAS